MVHWSLMKQIHNVNNLLVVECVFFFGTNTTSNVSPNPKRKQRPTTETDVARDDYVCKIYGVEFRIWQNNETSVSFDT